MELPTQTFQTPQGISFDFRSLNAACHELTGVIQPEILQDRFQKVAQDYQKRAQLDGFRPGKAPMEQVKRKFHDKIQKEALDELLMEIIRVQQQQNTLPVIGGYHLTKVPDSKPDPESGYPFTIYFETLPTDLTPQYQGLAFHPPVFKEVDEAFLEEFLEKLRNKSEPLPEAFRSNLTPEMKGRLMAELQSLNNENHLKRVEIALFNAFLDFNPDFDLPQHLFEDELKNDVRAYLASYVSEHPQATHTELGEKIEENTQGLVLRVRKRIKLGILGLELIRQHQLPFRERDLKKILEHPEIWGQFSGTIFDYLIQHAQALEQTSPAEPGLLEAPDSPEVQAPSSP